VWLKPNFAWKGLGRSNKQVTPMASYRFLVSYCSGLVIIWMFLQSPAFGADSEEKLTDQDLSRGALAEYALASAEEPADRAIIHEFKFPVDAKDGIYGIDVSHYNGTIMWSKIPTQGVQFAYVKASQGSRFYDGMFAGNWNDLRSICLKNPGFRRGAYHFLAADSSGATQAQFYLNKLEKNGGLSKGDLPPVLDVEWDFLVSNGSAVLDSQGHRIDRWNKLTRIEIAQHILDWLHIVQQQTSRQPIIYTNSIWWKDKVGNNPAFAPYHFWIADYRKSAIDNGAPAEPPGLRHSMWQFTDHGNVSASTTASTRVDTTSFAGDKDAFNALSD
jgi:lysozyme